MDISPSPLMSDKPIHEGCSGVDLNLQAVEEEEKVYKQFKELEMSSHLLTIESFTKHSNLPCKENLHTMQLLYEQCDKTSLYERKLQFLANQIWDKSNKNNCTVCTTWLCNRLKSRRKSITLTEDNSYDMITALISLWELNTTTCKKSCSSDQCKQIDFKSKLEKYNPDYNLFWLFQETNE